MQEGKVVEQNQVENTLHDEDYAEPPREALQCDIEDICTQMAPPVEMDTQPDPESQGADQIAPWVIQFQLTRMMMKMIGR